MPANLKLLQGRGLGQDSGGRPVKPPPPFMRKPPSAPSWLSKEAAAEWRRVVPGLTRLRLLKVEDRAMLTAYCETWATYVLATRDVHEHGLTIEVQSVTKDGDIATSTKPNPSVLMARQAGKELRAFAIHFGLSPSSEAALGQDDGADDAGNPFAGTG
jgi:P27 family predicted phage terminase small subunit